MWTQDIPIGPLVISGYGLALTSGVFLGLYILKYTAPRAGTSFKKAFDLSFWLIVAGITGSRLAYVIFHPVRFYLSPADILKYWQGGLMFQGGLLAGLAVIVILSLLGRLSLPVMADAIAPGLALGQAIGRLGCFAAGCCFGRLAPDYFPLTLTFPFGSLAPAGLPLYPTQLMESLGLFCLTGFLLWFLTKTRPAGLVSALYLCLAGLLRLTVDYFRGDYRGPKFLGLVPTSWTALFLAAAGLILGLWLISRQKRLARMRLIRRGMEVTVTEPSK
jgi:phosphatidylglycerol:prolipoprotein diacylglycerol transferase